MEVEETGSVKGDRALGPGDDDKLGFRDVSKTLAASLVDQASSDGLVIGLEGIWGSGKSSLLFLICEELGKLPADKQPTVINFRPWLIGNRDALISSLFGDISKQLDQIAINARDTRKITAAKAKAANDALRTFMNGLSKTGALIEVAGEASGVGPVKWIGKGVSAVGSAFGKKKERQLTELKASLVKALRNLNHRIVITIDDVDRLEPSEVIEVLRLVRSVIDLPNVVYLLCYDGNILARSIEKAAKIKDGRSYL